MPTMFSVQQLRFQGFQQLRGQKFLNEVNRLHLLGKLRTTNSVLIALKKKTTISSTQTDGGSPLTRINGIRSSMQASLPLKPINVVQNVVPIATDEFIDSSDDAFFIQDSDGLDGDLDRPTEGFNSIAEAIEDIQQGKFVIVVDDESRENEGDLIMTASKVTPEAMAFIVKHGTGIVCVAMKGEDLERLDLPLMVSRKENEEKLRTTFTVSVDAKSGTTTGVSAHDRANTILALASPGSRPEDFNRPGHIFPLKHKEGGVLKRAGHTEASVDLAMLAGLDPAGVLCELVDDDGSMARLPRLREFAEKEKLKIISIADLIWCLLFSKDRG